MLCDCFVIVVSFLSVQNILGNVSCSSRPQILNLLSISLLPSDCLIPLAKLVKKEKNNKFHIFHVVHFALWSVESLDKLFAF